MSIAQRTVSKPVSLSRRALFQGRITTPDAPAVRPPWSLDEAQFLDTCTTCDKCVFACEDGILKRGAGGYPEVDFQNGECTFCGACVAACAPNAIFMHDTENTGAVLPWTLEARIGSGCLSTNGVMCRVCGDRCDVRAIRFQLAVGGIANPIIDQTSCTGCGACVRPCPVGAVEVVQIQEQVQLEEQS